MTPARSRALWAALLLAGVTLFCATTRWGRGYPTFVSRTRILWREARAMTPLQRRLSLYDETFPVLLYLRENTPADAVILLPPALWIDDQSPADIPLLASSSSAYSFIYPRVPVHYGQETPWSRRITDLLVWNWWGLDRIAPGAPRTGETQVQILPWPPGVDPREVFGPPGGDELPRGGRAGSTGSFPGTLD